MTDANRSTARFHFDPDHDPSRTPDFETFVEAIVRSMWSGDGRILSRMAEDACREVMVAPSLLTRLHARLTGRTLNPVQDARRACMERIAPELRTLHAMMREFGMDMSPCAAIDSMHVMLGLLLCERSTGRIVPDMGVGDLDELRQALLYDIEGDALKNLYDSRTLRQDRKRMVAALRAASDEAQSPNVRAHADSFAEMVEDEAAAQTRRTPPSDGK